MADQDGNYRHEHLPSFLRQMHRYCNKPIDKAYDFYWSNEWLIDKPGPLTHEDVMTGDWWYDSGSGFWVKVVEYNALTEKYYLGAAKTITLRELSKLSRSKCPPPEGRQ